MNDLISRQDLIDRCDDVIENGIPNELGLHVISVEAVKDVVENMPSAQQWIPCSERLPEDGMRIIVQCGDGGLGVIERVRLKIWNLINSPYAKVVAWMPAPEPWEGEK